MFVRFQISSRPTIAIDITLKTLLVMSSMEDISNLVIIAVRVLSTIDYCDWGEYSKFMFEKNGLLIDYGGPGRIIKGIRLAICTRSASRKENQVGFIMFWWQPEVLPVDLQVSVTLQMTQLVSTK